MYVEYHLEHTEASMARKVITTVLDDIDGSEGAETVTFSYKGVAYEIDLSDENAQKLEDALEPYVSAGRKVGRGTSSKAKSGSSVDLNAVRAWAADNGIEVAPRGRVAASVIEQYEAANK
jgi:hypothetical protein